MPPFCSACGLADILACRTVTMVPSLFIDNLKAISTSFTPGHHEDAHEFFISVLDHLNRHRSLDTDTFVVGDVETGLEKVWERVLNSRLLSSWTQTWCR